MRPSVGRTGSTYFPLTFGGQYGYQDNGAPFGQIYYAIMRELNSTKGRWISRDPIGFDAGDWNLYRYVENNPTILADPTGLAACSCDPDITAPMHVAMAMLITTFRSWSAARKHGQCYALVTRRTAGDAWDALEPHCWAWGQSIHKSEYPWCAQGPLCQDSLQMSGGCWYGGSINYVTFGIMMRLCYQWTRATGQWGASTNFTLSRMNELIWLHKKGKNNVNESIAWADTAWNTLVFNCVSLR